MGAKILVVDDSAFARQIVRNALNRQGFRQVIEAEDGEEGLRKYEKEKPDVVLLDVIMPGLHGNEVLKKILNMNENAKVIMLSAVGQEKIMNICNKLGSVGYIVKPFEDEQLVDTVRNALQAKEKGKPSAKLTELEVNALRMVGGMGARHMATTLSKMIGRTVNAELLAVRMSSWAHLPELVGDGETVVSGVCFPVTGDISGSLLMVFPQKSAFILVDMLLKKKLGTTKELDEMDKSALSEAANVLAGNCLVALSNVSGMHLVEQVPDFAHDMVGALIDARAKAERALIIQVELSAEEKTRIVGYVFLLFALEEAHALLRAIRTKARAEKL